MNDADILKKRLSELSERSLSRGIWTYSEFLTMAEQGTLLEMSGLSRFYLFGGYDGAERRIACFGDADELGYEASPPVTCLVVEPVSKKFADELTHRDFLGALMSLGVKRETLGDIVISGGAGYVFCLSRMAEYISDELTGIRRTTVTCRQGELPASLAEREPGDRELVIQSPRADAVTAAVYKLSRSASQELFSQGKIFLNSRALENTSRELSPGDIISVRGKGRFIYDGAVRETKKGRLRIKVRVMS